MHTVPPPNFDFAESPAMPMRVIKPILSYLGPSEAPGPVFVGFNLIAAGVASWLTPWSAAFAGLPVSFQVLVWAMAVDYITGAYACKKNGGRFSWRVGADGIVRKAVLASTVYVVGWKILPLLGPLEQLASMIAYAFAINELGSVVTHLKNGRFQVPPIIDDVQALARRQFERRAAAIIASAENKEGQK